MAAFDFASLELDDAGDSREERVSPEDVLMIHLFSP